MGTAKKSAADGTDMHIHGHRRTHRQTGKSLHRGLLPQKRWSAIYEIMTRYPMAMRITHLTPLQCNSRDLALQQIMLYPNVGKFLRHESFNTFSLHKVSMDVIRNLRTVSEKKNSKMLSENTYVVSVLRRKRLFDTECFPIVGECLIQEYKWPELHSY